MRILVISDSHGRNDDVKGVLEQVGEIDMLIHCGDVERGDQYIRDIAGCPVVMVAGNNDYYLDLPSEETIEVEGYRIWVTHGHPYYVNSGVDYLREYGEMHDVDVVMYGHTHVPFIQIRGRYDNLKPREYFLSETGRQKANVSSDGDRRYGRGSLCPWIL